MSEKTIAEQIAAIAVVMVQKSVWRTASVPDQPSIILVRWRVIETQNGERHFVGFNLDNWEGRVSTTIEEFNASERCGVTRSGRVYQLLGEPGYDPDGEWVWNYWVRKNNVTSEKDVTEEINQLFSEVHAVKY